MRKKQMMLDEGYLSALMELRLILSYDDKDSEKNSTSQTSINDIFCYFCELFFFGGGGIIVSVDM